MARKKVRKTKSRKPVKRKSAKRKNVQASNFKKSVVASRRKLKKVGINLIIFLVLTLLSWFLSATFSNPTAVNLFFLLTWIFGFIGVAFLIVFLVLWLMRVMNK
jgi:ABC-type bacteriocin/lantibiotic exporter with double-glycine peptidase domain